MIFWINIIIILICIFLVGATLVFRLKSFKIYKKELLELRFYEYYKAMISVINGAKKDKDFFDKLD